MKRATLAVFGILLSLPSWAGGSHFVSRDYVNPPLGRGIGVIRPHDYVNPPLSRGIGILNSRDYVNPPLSHGIGILNSRDYVNPPLAHGTATDLPTAPLVKPAWKE